MKKKNYNGDKTGSVLEISSIKITCRARPNYCLDIKSIQRKTDNSNMDGVWKDNEILYYIEAWRNPGGFRMYLSSPKLNGRIQ